MPLCRWRYLEVMHGPEEVRNIELPESLSFKTRWAAVLLVVTKWETNVFFLLFFRCFWKPSGLKVRWNFKSQNFSFSYLKLLLSCVVETFRNISCCEIKNGHRFEFEHGCRNATTIEISGENKVSIFFTLL